MRIGVSLGAAASDSFTAQLDEIEGRGIDSLWLSERVFSSQIDPFVGLTWALARTKALKVGTSVAVLPGRSPILVAKQLASLARLAPRRVLPVFGLAPALTAERVAFPVPQGKRAAVFDESLELVRLLLRETTVSWKGEFFQLEDATVGELPSEPLDIWLGGSAEAGLRRIGRYGDGWLASFITPDEAAKGIETINAAAAEAGRSVDQDHFGINIPVTFGEATRPALVRAIQARRPELPLESLVPRGWEGARRLILEYVKAGMSKFVVSPAHGHGPDGFLEQFVTELIPLLA